MSFRRTLPSNCALNRWQPVLCDPSFCLLALSGVVRLSSLPDHPALSTATSGQNPCNSLIWPLASVSLALLQSIPFQMARILFKML